MASFTAATIRPRLLLWDLMVAAPAWDAWQPAQRAEASAVHPHTSPMVSLWAVVVAAAAAEAAAVPLGLQLALLPAPAVGVAAALLGAAAVLLDPSPDSLVHLTLELPCLATSRSVDSLLTTRAVTWILRAIRGIISRHIRPERLPSSCLLSLHIPG